MRMLVTGAAGFIGSHLSERLLSDGHEVLGLDNLSAGLLENLPKHKNFEFKKLDIRDERSVLEVTKDVDSVFHFAADPLVKESAERPAESFEVNARGTLNLLEGARKHGARAFVFASTSAVYGDAKVFPTPETYPIVPISNYAASKISAESYVSSYCSSYGMRGTVLRYANIFGQRSRHGVAHDFYFKLKRNPRELLILGNGKQSKSYLFISDCIGGSLLAYKKQRDVFDIFNIGSDKAFTVDQIADIVSREMGVSPKYSYTGGERGWVGDVPKMRLDVRKLKRVAGWKPKVSLREGVRIYLKWLGTQRK